MTEAHAPILLHNEDELLLRDGCRRVLDGELPIGWVRSTLDEAGPWPRQWSTFTELGWTALVVPEAFGGMGLGLRALTVVAEELGRAMQPGPLLASSVFALALARLGTDDQQQRWLPTVARGELMATWSIDVDGSGGRLIAERVPQEP